MRLNLLQRKAKYKHEKFPASKTSGKRVRDLDAKMSHGFDAVSGPQAMQAPGIHY